MKEYPILFSAPMVRAILAGTKTQTRRVIKHATGPSLSVNIDDEAQGVAVLSWLCGAGPGYEVEEETKRVQCPHGQPGDRLWVRETWAHDGPDIETVRSRKEDALGGGITYGPYYRADPIHEDTGLTWRPSIHMPRWASRITLEVTGVRVERLQDISVADAVAEGVDVHPDHHAKPRTSIYSPVQAYRDLWESINGPGSWDANPWVWVLEFRRI